MGVLFYNRKFTTCMIYIRRKLKYDQGVFQLQKRENPIHFFMLNILRVIQIFLYTYFLMNTWYHKNVRREKEGTDT